MRSILVDAGPLIALFDRSDREHERVKKFLAKNRLPLVTTWPILTEVSYMLRFDARVQVALLEWVSRGALKIRDLNLIACKDMADKMTKYSDIPMDLADASLVWVSEQDMIREIISFDSDYCIYKTKEGKKLENLLSP
jgi:predicted nucleic acid-binding protein